MDMLVDNINKNGSDKTKRSSQFEGIKRRNFLMKQFISLEYPRLKDVNKAVSDSVCIFGFFNLALGIGLYSDIAQTLDFFIINDVFTHRFWGILFFTAGAALLTSLYFNYWRIMRTALVFCLFLKFIWIVALSFRQLEDPSTNIFLIMMFTTLGVQQVSTYLRFPEVKQWKK